MKNNRKLNIIFLKGVRSTGGYGDIMKRQSIESVNSTRFYSRYFADLLFWGSINIFFLNIIFGIIIDSFACIFILNFLIKYFL